MFLFSSKRINFVYSNQDFGKYNEVVLNFGKPYDFYLIKLYHNVELNWRDILSLFKNLKKTSPEIFYTDHFYGSESNNLYRYVSLPDWSKIFFSHVDYVNFSWGVKLTKTDFISHSLYISMVDWVELLDERINHNSSFINHFRITPFLFLIDNLSVPEIPFEFARNRKYVSFQGSEPLPDKCSVIIPTALFSSSWFDTPMPTILPLLLNLNFEYSNFHVFDEVIFILSKDGYSESVLETLTKISEFPFKIIFQEGDFNFSKKVNSGVNAASNNNLLIVNDDISFITRNVIGELCSHLINPEVGAAGAALFYENGMIQHLGQLSYNGIFTHDDQLTVLNPLNIKFLYPREVSGVTGALFATKKKYWKDLGGFDENLAENFNDTDFMLRLGHSKSIIIDPRVLAYHKENVSRPKRVSDFEIDYMLRRHKVPKIDKFFSSFLNHQYKVQ
jgi:GT2 family glycosyltransferase